MSKIIKLKILTPEKIVYQDEVLEITLPTESGEITILPHHAPLVSIVKTGEIRIKKQDNSEVIPFAISTGVVEIRTSNESEKTDTEVIILASQTESSSDIDIDRAQEAYKRAEKAMQESENLLDVDYAKLQAVLEKELNRINIAKKWRK